MAHSVEARLPFLDYQLLELTMSLPDHYKIRNGTTKAPLRHSLREILPAKILNRHQKLGFVTPEDQFFLNNRDYIVEMLKFGIQKSNGLISEKIVDAYLRDVEK